MTKASELQALIGQDVGVSKWFDVTQARIDAGLAKSQVQQLAPEEERVVHAAAKFRDQVSKNGMTQELKMKIYRFLAYRGFSAKAIRAGIESLGADGSWAEEAGDENLE